MPDDLAVMQSTFRSSDRTHFRSQCEWSVTSSLAGKFKGSGSARKEVGNAENGWMDESKEIPFWDWDWDWVHFPDQSIEIKARVLEVREIISRHSLVPIRLCKRLARCSYSMHVTGKKA
jgi:hypothetical protein